MDYWWTRCHTFSCTFTTFLSINLLMKLVKKYPYKHYNRFSDTTGRKYLVDNIKVPSVTTILGATKDKSFFR
jgi:hypothetical protein